MEAIEFQEHLHLALISLVISFGFLWFAFRMGFFNFKPRSCPTIKFWHVLLGFFLFLMGELIFPLMLALFFQKAGDVKTAIPVEGISWSIIAAMWGGLLGVLIAFFTVNRKNRFLIFCDEGTFWVKSFFIGFVSVIFIMPLVIAVEQVITLALLYYYHELPIEQNLVHRLREAITNKTLFFMTTGSIVTLVPLTEELLFRGLLQNWIQGFFKCGRWSVIPTSLLFAFMHLNQSQGVSNIPLGAAIFILSCFLGLVYEQQRSLWAPIGLHAAFNGLNISMIYFS